ncbi:MAG: FAD-binding protein [Coriobacteriia bacterium]
MSRSNSSDRARVVSRRDFLKKTAIVGAGIASTGALAACSKNAAASAESVKWDKEVDVLVIGSGTAAIAALSAKGFKSDASVLLIEKSNLWGGTTGTSGAALWIPMNYWAVGEGYKDNRDDAIKYMKAASRGRGNDALIEAYIDNGSKYLEWTHEKFGWDWVYGGGDDYFQGLPGTTKTSFFGRTVAVDVPHEDVAFAGMAFWPKLKETLEGIGVEIMLETAGKELITDASGKVIGAVAKNSGGDIKIKAAKGVVLGTGGFEFNDEMVRRFQPTRPYVSNSVKTNTGDGHNMGTAVGGVLALMDMNWGLPAFLPGDFNASFNEEAKCIYDFVHVDWLTYRGKPNAAVVNKYGKRFGNEASAYPIFNRAFFEWNTDECHLENVPAYFICDSEYFKYYTVPTQKAVGDPIPSYMVQADTLEALAQKLGIDAAGLAEEIAAFNADAAAGVDRKYHRGEKGVEKNFSGDYAKRGLPNNCLAPIASPPFYGAVYVPGTCGTNGGLVIDVNAQVLDAQNKPIPGLYAVGNCSAGVSGGAYCGSGMTVGSGSVMSWQAAKHMLGVTA